MEKMYVVPDKLLPVIEGMYRTFLEDCEKDVRVEVNKQPPNIAWFLVEDHPKQKEDGIVRVKGAIGSARFKLYINAISACFEMDRDTPASPEQVFYVFIQVAANYRTMRRLSPLNTHSINGLAMEDSPPVNAENYGEIPPEDESSKLGKLIGENFNGISFNECNGILCYYIFTEPCMVDVPSDCFQVYRKLILLFESAFRVGKAKLFSLRWRAKQRLFFVTGEGRIYCCKTDGSREFLEKHLDFIFMVLSNSRFKSVTFSPFAAPESNYRFRLA